MTGRLQKIHELIEEVAVATDSVPTYIVLGGEAYLEFYHDASPLYAREGKDLGELEIAGNIIYYGHKVIRLYTKESVCYVGD